MGTRSLTHIQEDGITLTTMYRQFDGYLDGLGQELYDFLKDIRLVNGISVGDDESAIANGVGCLAAQLISHLKTDVGNVYIFPPNSIDCGEEFTYTINSNSNGMRPGTLEVTVQGYDTVVFKGTVPEFGKFLENAS